MKNRFLFLIIIIGTGGQIFSQQKNPPGPKVILYGDTEELSKRAQFEKWSQDKDIVLYESSAVFSIHPDLLKELHNLDPNLTEKKVGVSLVELFWINHKNKIPEGIYFDNNEKTLLVTGSKRSVELYVQAIQRYNGYDDSKKAD